MKNKCLIVICGLLVTSISLFAQNNQSTSFVDISSGKDISSFVANSSKGSMALQPTPQFAMSSGEYYVTAGDIYSLAFTAGTTLVNYTIFVDTTYKIRVANLAILDVAGKTYTELKQQVESIVSKNYPLSGVQFVLNTPAVFKVTLKGEVTNTTIKQAWALTRLSSVLDNLTSYSSIRNVQITSASGKTNTYDLFKAQRFADLSQDPYVRPDDVITIFQQERSVTLSGGVERPGTYELLKNENLNELINYYGGGLTTRADTSRMELTRTLDNTTHTEKYYLTNDSISENFEVVNSDSVYIPTFADLKPLMFIEGALYSSNTVNPQASTKVVVTFNKGESYDSLIRRNSSMFTTSSDKKNAYIIRKDEYIPLNIESILYDIQYKSEQNVEAYDTLMVPFNQAFVTVSGAVLSPGRYPYIPGRDWLYYINLAGGFKYEMNSFDAVKITDINNNKMSKNDEILPETKIYAKSNSFVYCFNRYAPIITTVLTTITSAFTVYGLMQ